jgi:hypothetical protein
MRGSVLPGVQLQYSSAVVIHDQYLISPCTKEWSGTVLLQYDFPKENTIFCFFFFTFFFFLNHTTALQLAKAARATKPPTRKAQYAPAPRGLVKGTSDSNWSRTVDLTKLRPTPYHPGSLKSSRTTFSLLSLFCLFLLTQT